MHSHGRPIKIDGAVVGRVSMHPGPNWRAPRANTWDEKRRNESLTRAIPELHVYLSEIVSAELSRQFFETHQRPDRLRAKRPNRKARPKARKPELFSGCIGVISNPFPHCRGVSASRDTILGKQVWQLSCSWCRCFWQEEFGSRR